MKRCYRCKLEKEDSEFAWRNVKKGTRQPHCRECRAEQDKEYYKTGNKKISVRKAMKNSQDKLKAFLNRVKSFKGCSKCGDKRYYVLDFHHLQDKKFSIGESVSRGISIETMKKELRKCIILCSNCHRELHHFERLSGSLMVKASS